MANPLRCCWMAAMVLVCAKLVGAEQKVPAPPQWEQLKGKVVILHFFAEWCGPCKNDYPMLAQLHSNKRQDLVIIGIHTAGSDAAKVKKLLEDYKITYPVCEDVSPAGVKGWGQFCDAMGAKMAPHAILIDAQGKVADRGSLMDIYDSALKLLITKKSPATAPG